jgi:hypothetical protein
VPNVSYHFYEFETLLFTLNPNIFMTLIWYLLVHLNFYSLVVTIPTARFKTKIWHFVHMVYLCVPYDFITQTVCFLTQHSPTGPSDECELSSVWGTNWVLVGNVEEFYSW